MLSGERNCRLEKFELRECLFGMVMSEFNALQNRVSRRSEKNALYHGEVCSFERDKVIPFSDQIDSKLSCEKIVDNIVMDLEKTDSSQAKRCLDIINVMKQEGLEDSVSIANRLGLSRRQVDYARSKILSLVLRKSERDGVTKRDLFGDSSHSAG
mgnify:FL=1